MPSKWWGKILDMNIRFFVDRMESNRSHYKMFLDGFEDPFLIIYDPDNPGTPSRFDAGSYAQKERVESLPRKVRSALVRVILEVSGYP